MALLAAVTSGRVVIHSVDLISRQIYWKPFFLPNGGLIQQDILINYLFRCHWDGEERATAQELSTLLDLPRLVTGRNGTVSWLLHVIHRWNIPNNEWVPSWVPGAMLMDCKNMPLLWGVLLKNKRFPFCAYEGVWIQISNVSWVIFEIMLYDLKN